MLSCPQALLVSKEFIMLVVIDGPFQTKSGVQAMTSCVAISLCITINLCVGASPEEQNISVLLEMM